MLSDLPAIKLFDRRNRPHVYTRWHWREDDGTRTPFFAAAGMCLAELRQYAPLLKGK